MRRLQFARAATPMAPSRCADAGSARACPAARPPIPRREATLATAADAHEREADGVAERVLKMATPGSVSAKPRSLQRRCAACEARDARGAAGGAEEEALAVAAHGGRAMPGELRAFFEPRFGHDFSQVRLHADGDAARAARSVQARAYTIGRDIVFGSGEYQPATARGRELLAHELVHVVQQAGGSGASRGDAPSIQAAPRAVARKPLDVAGIDQSIVDAASAPLPSGPLDIGAMLTAAAPQLFGHRQGEVGFAANYPGGTAPKSEPAVPLPKADKAPVPIDSSLPLDAHYFPSGRLKSRERALILGGFHGDERPGWEVLESLVAELSAAPAVKGRPLFFHTVVVPRVNAGAIADELGGRHFWRNRCNRQLVDLNRNFPTGGTPRDTDCVNTAGAPVQPEVQAVIDLIKVFKPDRILSTHAISTPAEAGIFADPNTDPAAIALARGMAATLADASNRPFNQLGPKRFNPVYPRDSHGKVSGGTSLGAFGPTATGGQLPVITLEAPGFGSLAATGTRSKEAFLRPVRAFLTDPALLDAQPDEDILADIDAFSAAERIGFLTGRLPLANKIFERIRLRVETAVDKLNSLSPPQPIRIVSGLRLFGQAVAGPTGGSAQAKIVYDKFFLRGSPDTESFPTRFFVGGDRTKGVDRSRWLAEPSANRLAIILKFSALPGASRHHWGTDVDFNATSSAAWAPAAAAGTQAGPLFDLGVWLGANAMRAGFVQAYTAGRTGGYSEEPWHYSYAPIALGLRARYGAQVNLSTDVADAFLDDMKARAKADGVKPPADLDAAVKGLKIGEFVDTIGPGL